MSEGRSLKVVKYAKLQAVVLAYAGIIAGFLYAGFGAYSDYQRDSIGFGTFLAFVTIPVMPLYFAVFGFVSGLIGAFLYNVIGKWFPKLRFSADVS